jgi:hypothetical protein
MSQDEDQADSKQVSSVGKMHLIDKWGNVISRVGEEDAK